jgi:lysophospholipase L1-like esterase
MVNQMRARFERDLLSPGHPEYSHLIVFGGVNDLYSDLTAGRVPAKISRDLAWMYARAREERMRVVAITVAPWGGFSRYFNATRARATLDLNGWIQRQAEDGAIDHVIDAYGLLSCGDPERLCPEYARPHRDGLHFGRLGHEKLGRALYERVFSTCL